MMKHKLLLSLCACLIFPFLATAQDGWNWGDEPQRAKEKYTLLSDYVSMKNFKEARSPLAWLLANTPDLNKSLYMKGTDVYEGLLAKTDDASLKQTYQDSALIMYDLRVQNFGDEAEVLNRKGYYALTYWQQRPEKYGDLYELYKKIVELNGKETFSQNIKYYMYLVGVMKNNNLKEVDENKVIEIHEELTEIVEANIAKAADDKTKQEWQETLEYIDGQFTSLVTIDCAFIKEKLLPKLEGTQGEERMTMINETLGRMLKAKCTSEPEFLELSKELAEAEPTFTRYRFLYKAYIAKEDYAKAIEYMDKALPLAESDQDKADIYMTKAKIQRSQNSYGAARANYQKAAQLDPSLTSEAYTAIGDMYLSSGGVCKGTESGNPIHAKAIYIAAYNMYQKAGNGAKAAQAQRYFPTKEEIFTYSAGGTQVNTGCWVGETVTIPSL